MPSTFSYRLSTLRDSLKLNKAQFANIIGVTASNLTRYEDGTTRPNFDFLERIAKLRTVGCDVNLNWLITGEGDMFQKSVHKNIPSSTLHLCKQSYLVSAEDGDELEKFLSIFILKKALNKIEAFRVSSKFWDTLIFKKWSSINFLRIFVKTISAAKNRNIENLTLENAKPNLIKIAKEIELSIKDKFDFGISKSKQSEFVNIIVEEFDDMSCYVLLHNFDAAAKAIFETLDKVDQIKLKLE